MSVELPDPLLGERHRDARDAQLQLTDRGLRADPLAGRKRRREQPVGERTGRVLGQRRLVGTLDLALHLGLADDHRIEARDDPVQVACGLAVAVRVDRRGQLGRADPRLPRQHRQHPALGLDRVTDDEVELGPVAGRDRDRLVNVGGGAQLAHELRRPCLRQRQPLPDLDRGGLVRDPDRQQLAHAICSDRSERPAPV